MVSSFETKNWDWGMGFEGMGLKSVPVEPGHEETSLDVAALIRPHICAALCAS